MFSVSLWVRGCVSRLHKKGGLRVSNEKKKDKSQTEGRVLRP